MANGNFMRNFEEAPLPRADILGDALFGPLTPDPMPLTPSGGGNQPMPFDPMLQPPPSTRIVLPQAQTPPATNFQGGYDINRMGERATPQAPGQVQGGFDIGRIAPPVTPGAPDIVTPDSMGMKTFTSPGGGTVTMPDVLPSGRTAEDIQAAVTGGVDSTGYTQAEKEEIRRQLSGAPEDVKARIRRGEGAAQEKLAGKKIISSLKQQGMTDDEIKKSIGADLKPDMTTSEAVLELKKLQKQRQVQSKDEKSARMSEKIAGMEERDEQGNALNDAARFNDLERGWSGTGADPLGETLYDQMSKSQRNEFERLREKVSNDRAKEGDFTRLEKFLGDAELKSQRAYDRKQAQAQKDALELAAQNAQGEAQETWVKNATNELDDVRKFIKSDQFDDLSKEEQKKWTDREVGIMDSINKFNTTGVMDGASAMMSRDEFIADFQKEEGRAPTEGEINTFKGKAWQ